MTMTREEQIPTRMERDIEATIDEIERQYGQFGLRLLVDKLMEDYEPEEHLQTYISRAQTKYLYTGEEPIIHIDDNARVSEGDECVFVSAWVPVDKERPFR